MYEVTKKRTFLTFIIFTSINALILFGVVILYPKLGTKQTVFKKLETEGATDDKKIRESDHETDGETTERTKLTSN